MQEREAKDRKNVAEVTRKEKEKGTNERAQSCGLLPAHISVLMTIIIQRIRQLRWSSVDNYIILIIRTHSFLFFSKMVANYRYRCQVLTRDYDTILL